MAKIGLTEGFTLIPEGTHVFQITDVKYKEDFGKLEVYMQTQTGSKHIERFSLLKSDGSPNEGAYNAFSYFAKADKRPSEGWGGSGNTVAPPTTKTAPAASQTAPKTPMDLAALLG